MTTASDEEIGEWMGLFILYRNRGKQALTKAEYDRFAVLTKKMSSLLQNIIV